MAERDVIGAIQAEPDATREITMYLRHLADTGPRVFPVQLLARDAAAADHAAAAVYAQMRQEMLTGMGMFAADLVATGQLRVPQEEARDILWTYHSPELYELLVLERGWSIERYRGFLTDAVISALL
jgi:hypothetical protein